MTRYVPIDTLILPGKFWIGGTNLMTNRTWMWVPGSEKMSVTLWAPGEPDMSSEKRCIAIDFSQAFQWFSATCENKYNFLCELSLNSR
ncbi:hypothetical protein CHS0354_007231 [Potamilus streckersoni]|uniref:C-type lectin domain-containing protein n=1 Tax=Potamilus streckersoni TaxID=2493646 RepID=A0AAE0RYA6_9BIVA|nr:hypothetical protein CHS0354_007231 [Potamilus streckersoni]